ncbi:hypothetical protein KCU96_g8, partial [Aureobasidium melanogenum]
LMTVQLVCTVKVGSLSWVSRSNLFNMSSETVIEDFTWGCDCAHKGFTPKTKECQENSKSNDSARVRTGDRLCVRQK